MDEALTETRAMFAREIAEIRSRRDLPAAMRRDLLDGLYGERVDWLRDVRAAR
jgi:hypothetical protein